MHTLVSFSSYISNTKPFYQSSYTPKMFSLIVDILNSLTYRADDSGHFDVYINHP